jgi:Leucine-rich repeat (LRR) protein
MMPPRRPKGIPAILAIAVVAGSICVAGCGDQVASGNGGGMETTNGVTAAIRRPDGSPGAGAIVKIRRADFISGDLAPTRGTSRDTLADSSGRFELRGFEPGAYTLEVSDGRGLAWVRQNLRIGGEDSAVDLGAQTLKETGALRGVVNVSNLPPGNRLRLAIYGLDRRLVAGSDGSYALEGLAPAEYELLVFSDSLPVTGKAAVFASVHGSAETTLDSVFLPMDYRSDSLAVRAYLDRQGITAFDWPARVGVFTNRIRILRLNGLGISRLDPSVTRLAFVNSLYLGNNPLAGLPDDLGRLTLFVLSLDSVPLAAFPPQVFEMSRLRQLSLAHTGLRGLPDSLRRLSGLTSLNLEGNGLDSVPSVVPGLAGLTTLRIGHNPLDSLPAGLSALTRLEQLYVGGAGLDSLPAWISGLPRLEVVHAYSNRLTALPDSIGRLTNLKVLALGDNRIASLPSSLGACANLAVLKLAGNGLAEMPPGITALAPRELDVSRNGICDPDPVVGIWLDRFAPAWKSQQTCP